LHIDKEIVSKNQINLPSLALMLVVGLWLLKTVYALWVQVQFSVTDIMFAATIMAALFIAISTPLLMRLEWMPLSQGRPWHVSTLTCMVLLMAFAYSPSKEFIRYVSTFPLLQAESGLGWHQDTAFHVTLIQSILNNGWPSIGQHGVPVTFYHVLSHYVDAAILLLTGLDPWDSYGLLYSYKEWLLISALVMMVAFASQGIGYLFFALSLLFFIPVAIGTWHAIGSHGLWFTSLLNILFMPMVFSTLFKDANLTNKNYLHIFLIGIFLALGKVSTGVGFVGLVLCFLWLKNPKILQVYVLGLFWSLFFIGYKSLFSYNVSLETQASSLVEGVASRFSTLDAMLAQEYFLRNEIWVVLLSLGACIVFFVYSRNLNILRFIASTLASALSIVVFFIFGPEMNSSDFYYFIYGLNFQLTLLTYLIFASLWRGGELRKNKSNWAHEHKWGIVFALVTVLIPKTQFNFFKPDIKYVVNSFVFGPYGQISSLAVVPAPPRIDNANRLSIGFDAIADRPLTALKSEIAMLQKREKLTASNSLLFVPKEVFEKEVAYFKGPDWARGMLVTAVTGMPLVHGVKQLKAAYGYSVYDENALWRSRSELASGNACIFGKAIIVVEQLSSPKLSVQTC
jgi:hypothetical protein